MPRLRSRNEFPPGGFQFVEPRIPQWKPPSGASFQRVVQSIQQLRQGNPWLVTEHKKSTDPNEIANELDEYNAARLIAAGHDHFVTDGVGATTYRSQTSFLRPQRIQRAALAVGESVNKAAVGVGALVEWVGDDMRPVEQAKSEARAAICVDCPRNDKDHNWLSKVGEWAKKILEQVMPEFDAKTSLDEQLRRCDVCDCALRLKVHIPPNHLKTITDEKTLKALSAVRTRSGKPCWIATELSNEHI